MNLAIIEDDPLLRDELTEFFAKDDRIHCVFMVDSITRFQQFFREFMSINVILLDINLPDISGVTGISVIRRLLPNAEIVMHTIVNDYDTIFQCICAGANGYLLKDGNLEKLAASLLEIQTNGGCAISPSVARRILSYFQPTAPGELPELLSDHELKISRLLVDGLSYQEIANMLNITLSGVQYHIKNIYRKLHINSKGALLKRYRKGLLDF